MPIPTTEAGLTQLFQELGARSPERWARSQIDEGIPQLLRFLFLKGAWERVAPEGDAGWIDEEIQGSRRWPDAPYAGLGLALARMRRQGVSDADLITVARCLQAQMIFALGELLDAGPAEPVDALDDVAWGLFQVDEEGRPFGPRIGGLHESVLELDPTGRQMRP